MSSEDVRQEGLRQLVKSVVVCWKMGIQVSATQLYSQGELFIALVIEEVDLVDGALVLRSKNHLAGSPSDFCGGNGT